MKKSKLTRQAELNRRHRLIQLELIEELKVNPGYQTGEDLWQVTPKLPTDFEPYGQRHRDVVGDCSCGCRWFHVLAGRRGEDWGICANRLSPRAGLLTFEHQGCSLFEMDPRSEYLDTIEGTKAKRRFEAREAKRRLGIRWITPETGGSQENNGV